MFTPSRFIVLDDKKTDLDAIVETFTLLGSSCIGLHYNLQDADQIFLNKDYYKGVRGLFVDLHLNPNATGSDDKPHFGEITRILEQTIQETNGPFILILWSLYPQKAQDLQNFIETRIDPDKPYCKPIHISSLAKLDYIDESGSIKIAMLPSLKQKILDCFNAIPQFSALFNWEEVVFTAINQTLVEMIKLIPPENRTLANYPNEIDTVLSTLSREAVGIHHVAEDPRHALNMSFAPILLDKILNDRTTGNDLALWQAAISKFSDPSANIADEKSIGRYNKMLHLAVTGGQAIQATDWGAVLNIDPWNDELCQNLFDLKTNQIKGDVFRFKKTETAGLEPIFIRVGAVCDYAQKKDGTIPYYLGYKVPLSIFNNRKTRLIELLKNDGKLDFEWHSPLFFTDEDYEPFYFICNLKYLTSFPKSKVKDYQIKYRLREQLLTQLILRGANYASRPGIIELRMP